MTARARKSRPSRPQLAVCASAALLVLLLVSGTSASGGARAPFLERCPKQLPKAFADALRRQLPKGTRMPAFDRARVCGIPAPGSGSKPASTREVVVGRVPASVSLTKIKSATRASVERVQAQVARCYRRAGKRAGPPDDSRIQPATDAMLRNQRVLDAAQRLRTNALAERTNTRAIAEAEAGLSALVEPSYRRLMSDFARDANLQVPTRRIACTDSPSRVVKPDETVPVDISWVELHSSTKGDHASYGQTFALDASGASVNLSADVGWDSEASSSAVVQGWFEVPAHVNRATIAVTYTTARWADVVDGLFGHACAYGLATTSVFRLNGGPSAFAFDWEPCLVDLAPGVDAPVPNPQPIGITKTQTMTLVDPPSGFYVVWVDLSAEAWSHGTAAAWSNHFASAPPEGESWEATLEFD